MRGVICEDGASEGGLAGGSSRAYLVMMIKHHKGKKASKAAVVFLFDVDNTLLDTDRATQDIRDYLKHEVGDARAKAYWRLFDRLRDSLGYADYLGALQQYRKKYPHDLHLLKLSRFLINYPFANRLYPKALDAIEHVQQWGVAALLSDGDVVFQPHKVDRSGLFHAVHGNVRIYIHKEDELKDVERCLPARHYVVFDDKIWILAAIKKVWRRKVTTVFVRQGHYAQDRAEVAKHAPADKTIESIGDLVKHELEDFVP